MVYNFRPDYQNHITGLHQSIGGHSRFYVDLSPAPKTKLHHHNYVELSYYIEGSGTEWINNKSRQIIPGTVSFILPYQIHGLVSSDMERPLRKYRIMFDLQILNEKTKDSELIDLLFQFGTEPSPWVELDASKYERMKSIFDCLIEEFHFKDTIEKRIMIRTKLTEALLHVIRSDRCPDSIIQNKQTNLLDEPTAAFWKILHYIHTNYAAEDLTLDKISEIFHMSVPNVSRSFKKYFGKGFLEYVHFLKIEHAATLLKHTSLSITDISYEVGFQSQRTFSRVFRNLKGMSANEYRIFPSENNNLLHFS